MHQSYSKPKVGRFMRHGVYIGIYKTFGGPALPGPAPKAYSVLPEPLSGFKERGREKWCEGKGRVMTSLR